jgi:chorismate synthase
MSYNTFGHMLRVTTFGESHGPAIGCVVDGCPPGLRLSPQDIQFYLDRRRPGQSRFTTQRREPDEVKILSGVFEDDRTEGPLTTGAPICLLIDNVDQRSKDYSDIRDKFRPGHADFTYVAKYGFRDYRGGGRSSARETAARVAAGAVARKIIPDVVIRGALVQMGPHRINRENWDWDQVDANPFFTPDKDAVPLFESFLDGIRKNGSSCGAVIEVVASGVPAGLGAPIYGKLDQELAAAMMGINAVKGVEIGAGFAAAALGGISSGQDVIVRFAVKPTSSILIPRRTITTQGEDTDISTKGRHDPCVGIRAVPVGEAMMACVLGDHYLRHRGQMG